MEMVAALGVSDRLSLEEQMMCLIMPAVEHHVELGTPSWYGRFLAQIVIDPTLREHVIGTHLNTPSIRRLSDLGYLGHSSFVSAPTSPIATMIRQVAVHMCAELEYDLAYGRVDPAAAEKAWRKLGRDLIDAICGRGASVLRR